MREIQDGNTLYEMHRYASQQYGEARSFMREVETVWKGAFNIPAWVSDAQIQITRPADGWILLNKMQKMVGIRSKRRYGMVGHGDSEAELARIDKLERFLRGYEAEHKLITQQDTLRMLGAMTLLRGRGAVQTLYSPQRKAVPVRRKVLDPMEYSPVYGEDGIDWYTIERKYTKWELFDYFRGLPDELKEGMDIPREDDSDLFGIGTVRVIEYWDAEQVAWCIAGGGAATHLVQCKPHDYGRVTLREARLGEMPLRDARWATMPFLGANIHDITQKAKLMSKMATAVELFYHGIIYAQSEDGAVVRLNPNEPPGTVQSAPPGSKLTQFLPASDNNTLQLLLNQLQGSINKGTLSDLAFALEVNDASGNAQSMTLNILQDDIADFRDTLERVEGASMGDVLCLHERFAPTEGWEYPLEKRDGGTHLETIRAKDIDGHYRATVGIKVDLPQDILQKATIFNQLYQPGPDGKYRIDFDTALEISGLAAIIEDVTGMKRRIKWYNAIQGSQELAALEMARTLAEYRPEIERWKRDVEQDERRIEQRDLKRESKDIERGLSQDVIFPAEIAANPQKMQEYAGMIAGGMTPQAAVETLMQGGLPLGVPGMPAAPPQDNPENDLILEQLFGKGTQVAPETPDGFTGYGGIDPSVMPPQMLGMMNRQTQDPDRLMVEKMDEQMRRGGLPAPK